jgi:nucleoredoxin
MSTSPLEDLLGPTLHSKDGAISTSEVKSDYIGLYFSASWCGPCRQFTPKLSKFVTDFREKPRSDDFDVVFVSSDKQASEAEQYYEGMPWKMLPYSDRDRQAHLSSKFKV